MGCKQSCCGGKAQTIVYKRNYVPAVGAKLTKKNPARAGDCNFFAQLRAGDKRDYIIVVDRSDSMKEDNAWVESQAVGETIATKACALDSNGITVIFFDHEIVKFSNVKTADAVKQLFAENGPRGMTDLSKALDIAFQEHFSGTKGATSILVITDGEPDEVQPVVATLQKALNTVTTENELSVSILHVGDDYEAKKFLLSLGEAFSKVTPPFLDVDVPSLQNMTFAQVTNNAFQ